MNRVEAGAAFKAQNVHTSSCAGGGVMQGSGPWLGSAPAERRLLGKRHISHLSGFLQIVISLLSV